MKKNLRGKIREFLASEDGKVSVKAPLTVGIATGSILLANAIVAPTPAEAGSPCITDDDCIYRPHKCLIVGSCQTL